MTEPKTLQTYIEEAKEGFYGLLRGYPIRIETSSIEIKPEEVLAYLENTLSRLAHALKEATVVEEEMPNKEDYAVEALEGWNAAREDTLKRWDRILGVEERKS